MVKLFIIFCCFVSTAFAITPEELQLLSGKGASEKRRVDQQLNLEDLRYKLDLESALHNKKSTDVAPASANGQSPASITSNVNQLVPESTMQVPPALNSEAQLQSSKYQQQLQQEHPQNIRTRTRQERYQQSQSNSGVYEKQRSTSELSSTGKIPHFVDAVMPSNKKYYGIRRGAWLRGEIRRDINSSEPGDVEIYITREVHGDKHTLPVDTVIFANKAFNSATNRLDFLVTYAIAPNGREFELKARVYDTLKVSGLDGIIDADGEKIVSKGMTAGMSAFGSSLLNQVGGNNPVGSALSRSGQSVIDDTSSAADMGTENQVTIYVAPQALLLRVESTF